MQPQTGLKPLEMLTQIRSHGFSVIHQTKKKMGLKGLGDETLYLNLTSLSGFSALILHPRHAARRRDFDLIPGVFCGEDFYHSSNMGHLFPKRLHKGQKEIAYGLALTIRDEAALVALLATL